MKTQRADGPKTEPVGVSQKMQQSIEEMIASMAQGVADCVNYARDVTPEAPHDHRRSNERSDATKMMTTTAELLSSIAKLKGEFQHNYNINRIDAKEREKERLRAETGLNNNPRFREFIELLDPEEVEALSDSEREDYFRDLKLPLLDLRRPSPATTPLPENAGSNSDAGES
jgi:hypothetical protein